MFLSLNYAGKDAQSLVFIDPVAFRSPLYDAADQSQNFYNRKLVDGIKDGAVKGAVTLQGFDGLLCRIYKNLASRNSSRLEDWYRGFNSLEDRVIYLTKKMSHSVSRKAQSSLPRDIGASQVMMVAAAVCNGIPKMVTTRSVLASYQAQIQDLYDGANPGKRAEVRVMDLKDFLVSKGLLDKPATRHTGARWDYVYGHRHMRKDQQIV
jgi:hypothetical protein